MIESGEVIEIEGSIAKIKFTRTSACGKCKICGFKEGDSEVVIETENTLGAKVQDRVEVSVAPGNVLKASAYAYIFPLVMLIIGLVLGYITGNAIKIFENPEIFAAICGIVLTAVSFIVIKITEPYIKKRIKNHFSMVAILQK